MQAYLWLQLFHYLYITRLTSTCGKIQLLLQPEAQDNAFMCPRPTPTGTRALSHSNSLQVPSLALRRSLPEPSHSVQTEPSRPPRAGACTAARPGSARLTRSALCLWPQGARDEDSAAAAAHARPSSGAGGPDPVPRGPRLSLPAVPGSLASGSGRTARSGERGREIPSWTSSAPILFVLSLEFGVSNTLEGLKGKGKVPWAVLRSNPGQMKPSLIFHAEESTLRKE
ncbi:uncharacterized protein RBU33_007750 [Hipposideros larvatus]